MAMEEEQKMTNNGEEWIDIVDEENQVIGQTTRSAMRENNLRHRACYIVVHDGIDQILVQRRTKTKDFYPDWLDLCAGGVVKKGEGNLASARREAEEELGIADVPFAEHGDFYFEAEDCHVWGSLFSCVYHGPFALQAEEIASVKWMTLDEIKSRRAEFTPDTLRALNLWLTRKDEL